MAYPILAMPDDELALIQYLRGVPEVLALIPAARITMELPPAPVYPVILVQRAGGKSVNYRAVDEPALQVDVVADPGQRRACKILTLTTRAAILAIANDVVPEAVLASASEEVGPQWLPDTVVTPVLPRYTARFRIVMHRI
jgi:hypothetical protein